MMLTSQLFPCASFIGYVYKISLKYEKMLVSRVIIHNRIKNSLFLAFRNLSVNSSTVDDNEAQHFKNYSSSWWDEMGDMKTLHSLNKLRVPFIRDGLLDSNPERHNLRNALEPLTDLKLLDIGCGGGLLCEPLARLGACVTGVDVSQELIAVAKQHASKDKKLKNLTYMCTTIENFASDSINKSIFDGVIASEVIEHVCDQERFVKECVNCLKPGGSIFFTTINKTLLSRILGIFIVENVLRLVPRGTHDYEKFVEPHILQRMLEDNSCYTKLIHGMLYNYCTNSWSWMTDKSICYALHAVKL